MSTYDFTGIKPGDKVILDRGGYGHSARVHEVEAVNGGNGGTILVDGLKFNMRGRQRASGRHGAQLYPYNSDTGRRLLNLTNADDALRRIRYAADKLGNLKERGYVADLLEHFAKELEEMAK